MGSEMCIRDRSSLERIRVQILEQLRYMHGAPSVQMHELPPDLAGGWVDEPVKEEE